MRFRVRRASALALAFAVAAAACAARKHPKQAPPVAAPPPRVTVGPFSLPAKIRVVAFHRLPEHFSTPIPPVWRADGLVLSLVRIARDGNQAVQFGGGGLGGEAAFELGLRNDGKGGGPAVSTLDFAIDPQGVKVAFAADDPADNAVKVFVRALAPQAEARLIATFPGQVDNAGVAWMSERELLLGLGPTRTAPNTASSAEFAGLYRLNTEMRGDNSQLVPDCNEKLDLSRFVLGVGRHALVSSSAGDATFLLDFERFQCRRTALPGLSRFRLLEWGPAGERMLYSAAPGARYGAIPAVFELKPSSGRPRLIGTLTASATYTRGGMIAIPGSRSLSPAALKAKPDRLIPAQLGIVDQAAFETTIYSLGLWTSAPLLARAAIAYSAAADGLAVEVPVPTQQGFAPVIAGFSLANRRVELIASAEFSRPLLFSWAPFRGRLAICDCAGETGSLLIVQPPLN